MAGIDETVFVPVAKAEAFARRIDHMNDRARRLGARARVELAEVAREPRPVLVTRRLYREGGFHTVTETERLPCVVYRMSCPEPTIRMPGWGWAGWIAVRAAEKDSVTGAVDAPVWHADPARPIAPGTVARAFDAKGRMLCEHCGTFRNRRMGFVVRDEAGAERVVGSSCLLDHVGHDPKAVQRCFASLSHLRAEIERERAADDFRAEVYDWEAHARAEREAATARDAVRHPLRLIVACALKAMVAQGFYARTTGQDRTATEEATRTLLSAGAVPAPFLLERADAILAWRRDRDPAFPADGTAPIALGDYLAHDPGFRIVDDYRAAGHAPVGRTHPDGESVELTYLRCEDIGGEVPTAYGTREVDRWRHVFRDDAGSRLVWETASETLDGRLAPGARLRVKFRTRRTWIERMRLVSRIANVRAA